MIEKKRLIVYGAGGYGKKVLRLLMSHQLIDIVAVCDSDSKKWGMKIEGYTVESPQVIDLTKKIDGVFVAIRSSNSILQELMKRDIRTYKEISELTSEIVNFDVSGKCNAKCKYCITGKLNREHKGNKGTYMSLSYFSDIYNHLYRGGFLCKDTSLSLFNWNEPFLNPEIIEILKFCSDTGQKFALSTNASIVKKAEDKTTYKMCEKIFFSMPGFSQESYNKIHGFKFEIIKKNIEDILHNMRECGFDGEALISAHKYRFSECEVEKMRAWAEPQGIVINDYYPYLAGNTLMKKYLMGKMSLDEKKQIKKDLFIKWDGYMEEDYRVFDNPICKQLSITEEGKIALCCAADVCCDFYDTWGNVLDYPTYGDYLLKRKAMLKCEECQICRKLGIGYRYLNNN